MLSPINKNIKLNYRQLNALLTELGYKGTKVNGVNMVYTHAANDSLITVRRLPQAQTVRDQVVAAVLRNIVNCNVADEAKVERIAARI